MKQFAMLAVLVCALPCGAMAQSGQNLFAPPTGFRLIPTQGPGPHWANVYGDTTPATNWYISQWGIPQNLPAFTGTSTSNNYASVQLNADSSFELMQNGGQLVCSALYQSLKTLPAEFDLLARPADLLERPADLASLQHVYLSGSVQVETVNMVDASCPSTSATTVVGIVITAPSVKQTFFYQLNFQNFRYVNGNFTLLHNAGAWFSRGRSGHSGAHNNFGFGDHAEDAYGVAPGPGVVNFNVDILPRIESLIEQGAAFGMDQNLADWAVASEYSGQAVFGHVQLRTKWNGAMLQVVPKP